MPRDVVVDITDDHRRFEMLLDRVTDPDGPAEWRRALDELTAGLATHTRAEELVVYPVVRNELDGEEAVSGSTYEHLRIAGTMARLSASAPNDPDLSAACRSLALELRFHIAQEESGWLAVMERQLDPDRRQELSRQFVSVKRSPTVLAPPPDEIHLDAPDRSDRLTRG